MRAEPAAVASYAAALLNVARGQGVIAGMREEAEALEATLKAQPQLQTFLDGPQIATDKKVSLIERVFKGRVHPVLYNLLQMLIARSRTALLPGVLAEFEETAQRAEGIFPGIVTTARPLDEGERKKLLTALERSAACKLILDFQVRPELLGGVVFRYKDTLVDGSIRHGLNEIKRRFEGDGTEAA